MAYEKTIWEDNKTPINAANLNKMEQGIEDAAKTGGVSAGAVIGWTKEEIPEGYEEIMLPSEIPVGMITDLEEGMEVPEGYEVIEVNGDAPDYPKRTKITLDLNTPYTVDEDAFFQVVAELSANTSGAEINIYADNNLFFYSWTKNGITTTMPATPLKKGTVVSVLTSTNATINFFKIPYLKKKQIKKVAVTPLPEPATASIINSTNIENKEENTYSANIIDGLNNGLKTDLLSKVLTAKGSSSATNMNDIKTVGIHRVNAGITNYPSGASTYGGIVMVFAPLENSDAILVQVFFDGNGGLVASRIYWYHSTGWGSWKNLS